MSDAARTRLPTAGGGAAGTARVMPVPRADVAEKLLTRRGPDAADVDAADRMLSLIDSGAEDWAHRHGAVHVTASVMLVHRTPGIGADRHRVLLTLHPRFGRWMQLGRSPRTRR